MTKRAKPDYGVDAPAVMRNLFLFGGLALLLIFVTPNDLHFGNVHLLWHSPLAWTSGFLLIEGCLFLLYVKVGKFRHRDKMLAMHEWRGDEQALDVGCGRGLLLAGAAKKLKALGGSGRATGLDVWSNVDMGGNSATATMRNLELESVQDRCELVSAGAEVMPFPSGSFDVIMSNLCLHNLYDRTKRREAVAQIARVLKPGGVALLSDYKLTGEYAQQLSEAGLSVTRVWGNVVTTFPPLRIVVARKPL